MVNKNGKFCGLSSGDLCGKCAGHCIIRFVTGPAGPAGPAGPDGKDGLDGPTGPQGATGATGPAGADGANGATGADGATGATGPAGFEAVNPYELYVRAGNTGGDGSRTNPFATVQEAYARVLPHGTVIIEAGDYPFTQTLNFAKDDITVFGRNGARIILQAATIPFLITGSDFTLSGLTFTSDNPYPVEFVQIGGDNALVDGNVFFGPDQSGPSTGWVVNRGVVTQNSVSGLRMINNLFYSLRQPAYFNPSSSGNVLYNTVYNTRGFVVDGAFMQFSGNSWGSPANAVDIALLSGTTSGVPYDSVPGLQASNSSANVSDQR